MRITILSDNEQRVINYLADDMEGKFVSPTQIGHIVGGKRNSGDSYRHSSWASPICKRLVSKGLLTRSDKGWYKYNPPTPSDEPLFSREAICLTTEELEIAEMLDSLKKRFEG